MTGLSTREQWVSVYPTKIPTTVCGFQPPHDSSLQLIDSIGLDSHAGIIDVGCGASTLVDDLLSRGFENITCIDISAEAVKPVKQRLGDRVGELC